MTQLDYIKKALPADAQVTFEPSEDGSADDAFNIRVNGRHYDVQVGGRYYAANRFAYDSRDELVSCDQLFMGRSFKDAVARIVKDLS